MFATLRITVSACVVLCACTFAERLWAGDGSFRHALSTALEYPVQYLDPASIQHGKQLLRNMIARYPHDPDVSRAQLELFLILRSEESAASYLEAAELISELVAKEDKSSDFFIPVAIEFAEFHLERLDGHNLQRADDAQRIARDLVEAGQSQDLPAIELQGRRYLALANGRLGNMTEAANNLFVAMDRCESWLDAGVFERERRKSFRNIQKLKTEMYNIAGALGGLPRYVAGDRKAMEELIALIENGLQRRGSSKIQTWKVAHEEVARWKAELLSHPRKVDPEVVQKEPPRRYFVVLILSDQCSRVELVRSRPHVGW